MADVAAAKPASAAPAEAPGGAEPPSSLQFASLYVGDLHMDCTEALLYEAFSRAGNVASCRVCRDSATRRSLGYAYVNYYSVQDAERALQTLNYMSIRGKPIRVMWSQRDPERRRNTASNVFVKGLDLSIDTKALHDTFSIFGNILSCKVATNSVGKSRGYGFVHYESEEAAKEAIAQVNGKQIEGSTVFVGPFIKREQRDAEAAESYTNLYVKNFPDSWDDAKVSDVFSEFGEVASSVLLTNDDGKRFALVNFQSPDAAKAAVEALHRKDLRDPEEAEKEEEPPDAEKAEAEEAVDKVPPHLLYVQRAQTRSERRAALEEDRRRNQAGKGEGKGKGGIRLCIRNLSEDVTSEQLREAVEPYGTIHAVFLKTDDMGKNRGVGFVVISSQEEAQKAIDELDGKDLLGKPLSVVFSERRRKGEKGEGKGEKGEGFKGPRNDEKGKGKGRRSKGQGGKGAPSFAQGVMLGPGMPGMMPMPRPGMPGGMPMMGLPPMMAGLPPFPRPCQVGLPPFPPAVPMAHPHAAHAHAHAALRPPLPVGGAMLPAGGLGDRSQPPAAQAQKQQLGERLYHQIARLHPSMAGKLTGMMLELGPDEILSLLNSEEKLKQKIQEAEQILQKTKGGAS